MVLCFRKLFPAEWFEGFKFPFIEDLVNTDVFLDYFGWRHASGLEWDRPLGPLESSRSSRMRQRMSEGRQSGAMSHKAALPPVLSYGLTMDKHFGMAQELLDRLTPTEECPLLDEDLRFAASCLAHTKTLLKAFRIKAIGILRELKCRWQGVTLHLRGFQTGPIQKVTAMRDVGLVGLLTVLMSWPDVTYPYGLITGLPAVGYAPNYGVFPQQDAEFLSLPEVLDGWRPHNAAIIASLRPGKDDEFALAQSEKDASKGFCTAPLREPELLRLVKGSPYRLIPRHVITQASGKQRIIDDAARGGQSERSHDANKLVLCSPFRPAQHVALVAQLLSPAEWKTAMQEDGWQGAGEDWPDAYRQSPISGEEALGCVVCFWHHEWQSPAFQLYSSLLFGLPLAVTSFNRYSKLVEAMGRKFLRVLVSMYFDDAHITDWTSLGPSAQWAFSALNDLLGTPFAEEKKQKFSPTGTFLGIDFDFSEVPTSNCVTFWARERLLNKATTAISLARESGRFTPAQAAKLYGLLNFLESGMFGRVGCGGLRSIKDRQYGRETHLTEALVQSFDIVETVLKCQPKRRLWLTNERWCRVVAASDAAQDAPQTGSGGYLILWGQPCSQPREAFVAKIDPELFAWFSSGSQKIAQLEMLMIAHALINRASVFRHRRGFWFIDNIASLMCLLRGRSDSDDLEKIARFIHVVLFARGHAVLGVYSFKIQLG